MATEQIPTSIIADDAVTGDKIENNPTVAGNLSVGGTLATTGALTASGGIANAGTISAGTLGSSVVGGNMAVGTVSESSGTPTGDIIQKGTVSGRGDYVRFADGTQICTIKDIMSSSSGTTWTYPVAFIDEPSVGGTSSSDPVRWDFGSGSNPISSTSWTFLCGVLSGTSGSGKTVGFSTSQQNLWAIGRWY